MNDPKPRTRFDDLDVRILRELSEDGRCPYTQVAERLGVSEATIRTRVSRLQRGQAIRFVTEIDPHQMGLMSAFLLLRIVERKAKSVVAAVSEVPEAIYVLPCVGTADIIVQVVCLDAEDLSRVIQEDMRKAGVEVIQTLVTRETSKVRYAFAAMNPK